MINRLATLLERANARWRDHLLTGLTVIVVVHLFITSPLEAQPYAVIKGINVVLVVTLAVGLLVLARSLVSAGLLLLFLCLVVAAFLVQVQGGDQLLIVRIRAGAWILMSAAILWIVVRAVYAPGPITYHRVVGAILLYLTIGVFFASVYAVAASFAVEGVKGMTLALHSSLPAEVVYFSFVTLTTVGYGDFTPVDPLIRGFSNIEAIIGQLYPATLLARLVSSEVRLRSGERAPTPSRG
ncbi:MAG: potassium channel family protein [Proteobacteria bacterium]|nr:potassium channel family protein [Pseudomonadota bacterium]